MVKALSQLLPGQIGQVKKVRGGGAIQRRIVDMGVVTGTKIAVQRYAPLGDPMEIKLKGFNLSLRKAEADFIEVEVADSI
ncbi:FeoA family protein [Acetonema longum]|uniref:FeoA family protein n=1 Tax=Acetonema longum DSM 6540 TaxID=1009370 RepID=F7NG46_9FIRM|nr:FeoA family protein [Acetonema longum]EGO64964.1 FeoA family protein [Acetonema longum DSM 6540]